MILGHKFIDLSLRRKKMNAKIEWFAQTSDKPYDRHQYKIEFDDGRSIIMDSYEELRNVWFEYVRTRKGAKVSVIDKKTQKEVKGFG